MAKFNLTDASALFKVKYGKLSDNVYNSANILQAKIKKSYDFSGKELRRPVPTGFSGGVGSGTLPTGNLASYEDAVLTAKKVYAVCEIDRETIKAASSDEGAFIKETKHVVQKTVESYVRNSSRILWGNGDGSLGVSSAANAGGTAAAPTIAITAASWKEANFEENDYVNIGSTNNAYAVGNVWEITGIDATTRVLTLARISGAVDLTADAAAKTVYMQNSKDNDPHGLKNICDATTGTLYGINVGRRWQATQQAAGGAGITVDRMNRLLLDVERKSGKVPDLMVTSYTQFRKILNMLEDQKQYVVEPRSSDLKGKLSFKGVEFMSSAGAIGIFADRFCEDDRLYALNSNYIESVHRPGFGWFDDDGTVFLRSATEDSYGARYGGYYQNYIVPTFQGVMTGLAT